MALLTVGRGEGSISSWRYARMIMRLAQAAVCRLRGRGRLRIALERPGNARRMARCQRIQHDASPLRASGGILMPRAGLPLTSCLSIMYAATSRSLTSSLHAGCQRTAATSHRAAGDAPPRDIAATPLRAGPVAAAIRCASLSYADTPCYLRHAREAACTAHSLPFLHAAHTFVPAARRRLLTCLHRARAPLAIAACKGAVQPLFATSPRLQPCWEVMTSRSPHACLIGARPRANKHARWRLVCAISLPSPPRLEGLLPGAVMHTPIPHYREHLFHNAHSACAAL